MQRWMAKRVPLFNWGTRHEDDAGQRDLISEERCDWWM